MNSRTLLLAKLVVCLAWAAACGRTEMGMLVHAPGSGGVGGMIPMGVGGLEASAGGAGGSGGATSGPCAGATCLTELFQTCVPEGGCSVQGGASPSASFNNACYANGVTVLNEGGYNGPNTTRKLVVGRNGIVCYRIEMSISANASAVNYVVLDARGDEVATGSSLDKAGSVAITCKGGTLTPILAACLETVGDTSRFDPGSCP